MPVDRTASGRAPAFSSLIRFTARHWPFANGAGRFMDLYARGIDLGRGRRECVTSDGVPLTVLADDHIGRHILMSGAFDRSLISLLLDFAKPGDTILDVGANIGFFSATLLHNIPDCTIIAVEPQPEIAEILEDNLTLFAGRYRIHRVALSDDAGQGVLQIDRSNRGASRIVSTASREADTAIVPLVPAGDIVADLERLDIVKIDVEGHEESVFRSGIEHFSRLQPRVILFEEQRGLAAPSGSIGRMLAGADYAVFGVRKKLMATLLEPATESNASSFNDFLAISRRRSLPRRGAARLSAANKQLSIAR